MKRHVGTEALAIAAPRRYVDEDAPNPPAAGTFRLAELRDHKRLYVEGGMSAR